MMRSSPKGLPWVSDRSDSGRQPPLVCIPMRVQLHSQRLLGPYFRPGETKTLGSLMLG